MNLLEFTIALTISCVFILTAIKLMDMKFGLVGVYIVGGFTVVVSATFTAYDATSILGYVTNVVVLVIFWTGCCIDYVGLKYGKDDAARLLNLAIITNILWTMTNVLLALIAEPSVEGIIPVSVLLGKSTILSTTLGLAVLKFTQSIDLHLLAKARKRWLSKSNAKLGAATASISLFSLVLDTALYFGGFNLIFILMTKLNYWDVESFAFVPYVFTFSAGVLKVILSTFGNVMSGFALPYLTHWGEVKEIE